MTQIGYPLAGTQVKTPQDWSAMAQNWLGTGVIKGKLNELQVYADSTGMQVKVKTGQAFLQGHFYKSDTEVVLPISSANASNPRIDRVIMRLDYTSDSIQLAVLQGISAVSPSAPALTQNNTRWEISLAQVRVNAAVSTIVAGDITDERNFVKNANAIMQPWIYLSTLNGWVSADLTLYDMKLFKDEFGTVFFNGGRIKNGTTTNGIAIVNIPSGFRPIKDVIWNSGPHQFELSGSNGNISGFGLSVSDTVVGLAFWKAEQ